MKKINKKGFTLVELLATITIMGILMLTAGVAVTIHIERSRKQAYDTMAVSAKNAASQYIMEYPAAAMSQEEYETFAEALKNHLNNPATVDAPESLKVISFKDLVDNIQLQRTADPADSSLECTGRVIAILNEGLGRELDSYSYIVHECCAAKQYKYTFSEKYVNKDTGEECDKSIADPDKKCNVVEVQEKISSDDGEIGIWCD